MEEGSFQKACEDLHELDFIEANTVPLPNEVPKQVDVSTMTEAKNRSTAIDTLITQNEDLMSRLAVNIRRNGLLEEKIEELELSNEAQKKVTENLKDQLLILKKKDSFVSDRNEANEAEKRALTDKIQFLEQKYLEFYNSTEIITEDLKLEKLKLSKQNKRLSKYRRNIKPIAQKLKVLLYEQKTENGLKNQNLLRLKEQIENSNQHIQNQNRENEKRISDLTLQYSNEIQSISTLLQETEGLNRELTEKLAKFESAFEENVGLKNEIIKLKREITISTQKYSDEITLLQDEFANVKVDLKQKTIDNKNLQDELQQMREGKQSAVDEFNKMRDQLETVQLLWSENQNENEKLVRQNQSLQRLNQQLSTKINEQRTDIKKLKVQMDESLLNSRNEIKKLKQSQLITKHKESMSEDIETLKVTTEALNKIEDLISEIQSGFDVDQNTDTAE